ncbi:MAG: hypothetical protein ACLQAT_13570 [Candidatus Binataceae bacterium]
MKPVGAVEESLADRWISDNWRRDRLERIESGLLTNADISVPDLIRTFRLLNDASRQRMEEMFGLAGSALVATATQDSKQDSAAEKAGASGLVRAAKTANGAEKSTAMLKNLLKDLYDQQRESARAKKNALGKVPPAGEGKGAHSLPFADAVLEGTARSFARNAQAFATLARYRSSIENSAYRALHELQRLQAVRAGQIVAAPAAVDVNVNLGGGHADASLRNEAPSNLTSSGAGWGPPTRSRRPRDRRRVLRTQSGAELDRKIVLDLAAASRRLKLPGLD